MCVAMMVPVVLPAVRHVSVNSLRWRRGREVAVFLTGYLAVWVALGAAVVPAFALAAGQVPAEAVLAAALGIAAAWQVLPYQRRFLRDGHRSVPLPQRGRVAAAASMRFGVRHGRACVGTAGR